VLAVLLFIATSFFSAQNGFAQSEEVASVSVTINGVEDELLTNIRGFLPLYRFDEKDAPSEGRLRLLHRQAEERIREALAPFGYYRPQVTATLEEADGVWQRAIRLLSRRLKTQNLKPEHRCYTSTTNR
jgi:translocation and assembly module TamA